MTDFKISVIVPVHNGERHITETLDCVASQTHPPTEVIVADDGSDDDTARIVSEFGPLVRLVSQSQSGPAAARNLGIREARGDLVAFIDHDDLWRDDKLALQLAEFHADPSLDLCVTHIQRFRTGSQGSEMALLGPPVAGYVFSTMLARRDVFERVGLLNASFLHSDQAEWFLRAKEQGLQVSLLPQVLFFHRNHETNRSRLLIKRQHSDYLRLAKKQMDKSRQR